MGEVGRGLLCRFFCPAIGVEQRVLNRDEAVENRMQNLSRRAIGVYFMDDGTVILFKNECRDFPIDAKTMPHDIFVGVIDPVFPDRSSANPVNHILFVCTLQIDNFADVEVGFDHFDLMHIAWHSVQDEQVFAGLEPGESDIGLDSLAPDFDVSSSGTSSPREMCL